MSRWLLDFATSRQFAGFVRLELREAEQIAWYWTYLVGVPDVEGLVVVRDHEVVLPRQGLEIRAEGLWAELCCEARREHWTFGLEAFGVRLDAAGDALRAGGEIGERVAVGLDLEWEVGDDGPPAGIVHGDVLVGRARHEIDALGWFYDDDAPDPGAVVGEVVSTVYVPLGDDRGYVERSLVRVGATGGRSRWSLDRYVDP
ncbi:MAG: hypothetical protein M3Q30_09825 [Actinomycetota bacterium]|nr:hypothetical protein [Actinomycetota bacterium]